MPSNRTSPACIWQKVNGNWYPTVCYAKLSRSDNAMATYFIDSKGSVKKETISISQFPKNKFQPFPLRKWVLSAQPYMHAWWPRHHSVSQQLLPQLSKISPRPNVSRQCLNFNTRPPTILGRFLRHWTLYNWPFSALIISTKGFRYCHSPRLSL